jgi:hypothetical protein
MMRFLLLTVMMSLSTSDSPRLGSEADPIRQRLFASQSMEVLVQGLKLNGSPGPFQTFADAVELSKAGKKEEAKTRLHSILQAPNLETRIQLWVWSALRELGEQPGADSGGEVLGVVIEVPMRGAYDTLAGYQDGSARYLDFSGKAIFWDKPDASMKTLCHRLIAATVPESSRAVPRKDTALPKSGTQVTLLTRSGMYVIVEPPQSIMAAGSALMFELMRRVKETEASNP